MAAPQRRIQDMTFEEAEQLYYDLKAQQRTRYENIDPDRYDEAMEDILRESLKIDHIRRVINNYHGQEELIFNRDGKQYLIAEYPRGGEIVNFTDLGQMYVWLGSFDVNVSNIQFSYLYDSMITMIALVKYRVGDREENWLYRMNNVGILKDNYRLYSGYKTMITGDIFRFGPVYSKLGLNFNKHPTSGAISIVRQATPDDAIVQTDDIRSSQYEPLEEDKPSPIRFRNEKLLKMLLHIE